MERVQVGEHQRRLPGRITIPAHERNRPQRGANSVPAVSNAQQRLMGMMLARKRAGQSTGSVNMTEQQLADFATKKKRAAPGRRKATDSEGMGDQKTGPEEIAEMKKGK